MATITSSRTAMNLAQALATETLIRRRYVACATIADAENLQKIAAIFRDIAQSRDNHAEGHLRAMGMQDALPTEGPTGDTKDNLRTAIADELHEYADLYTAMARTAHDEGLDDVAEWFEALAKASRSYTGRFQRALNMLIRSGTVGFGD